MLTEPRACVCTSLQRYILFMGRIDEFTVNKIKEAADIVDVVSDFITLKPAGSNYTAKCPFHPDRHAGNFIVRPKRAQTGGNTFKCFACEAKGGPIEFLMKYEGFDYPDALRYLGQKYGIFIDEEKKFEVKKVVQKEPPPPPVELPKRLFPVEWVRLYMADNSDPFVHWLHTLPWDKDQRERIDKVVRNYGIGHSHFKAKYNGKEGEHDFTIFWQCDEQARLHNGHFMKYLPDGHRVKTKGEYNTTWLHARMKKADPKKVKPFDDTKESASYCLFGQHLMAAAPDAIINIVESEKTAVLMAIAYGNMRMNLWMACFGKGNLTNSNQLLKPLIEQHRRIVLYPDHDGIEFWQNEARKLNYPRLSVNTKFLTDWWKPEDGDKADVADIILRGLRENKPVHTKPPRKLETIIQEWSDEFPAFKALNDRFGL